MPGDLKRDVTKPKKPRRFRGFLLCRDDKIRTCDLTPPRRVRYRAALHPVSSAEALLNSNKLQIQKRRRTSIPFNPKWGLQK
jgi:hypothetical protein